MNTAVEVACSSCGRRYSIDPKLVKDNFPCPECQGIVEIGQGVSPPPVDTSTAAPPSTSSAGQASPGPVGSPAVEQEHESVADKRAAKQSGPVGVIIVCVLLLVGVGIIAGLGVYLAGAMQKHDEALKLAKEREKNKERPIVEESDPTEVAIRNVNWATAGEQSAKFNQIRVRVTQVQFGEIRARDAGGEFKSSGDQAFLKVFLELRNQGLATEYKSWYRNPGNDWAPRLRDQDENEYSMMLFENAAGVQGHIESAKIEQDEEVQDVIIFALPEGVSISDVETLYLSLPGISLGAGGAVHFKIPGETITTPEAPGSSGLIGSPLSN